MFNGEGRYGQTTDWVKLMYGAFTGPRYVMLIMQYIIAIYSLYIYL